MGDSFDSVLFVAAILKAFNVAWGELYTPRILAVLLRDSEAYFGGVGAIAVTNPVIWSAARVSSVVVCDSLQVVAPHPMHVAVMSHRYWVGTPHIGFGLNAQRGRRLHQSWGAECW